MKESPIISNLISTFEAHRNPTYAAKMKAYMKGRYDFYGINQPLRKTLAKPFLKQLLDNPDIRPSDVIHALWEQPHRELLYVCLEYVALAHKRWTPDILEDFEYMLTHHAWWDTVDLIASNLVGTYFKKWYDADYQRIGIWNNSDNLWLNRTAIIFQLKYKDKTNLEILFATIDTHRQSKAFFHQKAIGWALRELAKTKPQLVLDYVQHTELMPLSKREALKHF